MSAELNRPIGGLRLERLNQHAPVGYYVTSQSAYVGPFESRERALDWARSAKTPPHKIVNWEGLPG